jgi:hypothetical protein
MDHLEPKLQSRSKNQFSWSWIEISSIYGVNPNSRIFGANILCGDQFKDHWFTRDIVSTEVFSAEFVISFGVDLSVFC